MADPNLFQPTPAQPAEVDPRKAIAERYLQRARAELADKEKEQKAKHHAPPRRAGQSDKPVGLGELRPRIAGSTLIHLILLMPVTIVASLMMVWCLVLLEFHMVVGRTIVMPAGILLILSLSYMTAYYLGIIESTSHGETNPDEALHGNWQDWFWQMPATVGVFAMSAGIGYLISLPFPGSRWMVIGISVLLLYPFMQLSSLETGSPFAPFSWQMTQTLFTRPIMWGTVYAAAFLLAMLLAATAKAVWRDPPYFTVTVMGPLVAVSLLIYGLVLGTAARWLSLKGR